MKAGDVTDTLEMALETSGCDQALVRHKPRLLSDNGSCYISGELAEWLGDRRMDHVRGAPFHPVARQGLQSKSREGQTQGKITSRDISCGNTLTVNGTLASNHEEPRTLGKLLSTWRFRTSDQSIRRILQQRTLSRELKQRHTRRCVLRTR